MEAQMPYMTEEHKTFMKLNLELIRKNPVIADVQKSSSDTMRNQGMYGGPMMHIEEYKNLKMNWMAITIMKGMRSPIMPGIGYEKPGQQRGYGIPWQEMRYGYNPYMMHQH